VRWDWAPEDFKILVQRVLNLNSVEAALIPQGILPLCSDPDHASILTIMMAVGASEERAPKGHDGAGGSRRGEQSTPRGGRASGSRDRGPGSSRPADARGKRKQGGTPPPSPPRGGGAARASSRRPEGAAPTSQPEGERKKKRPRKMGETEPSRGNLISPPKWLFNRPPRRFVSHPSWLYSFSQREFSLTHLVRLLVFSFVSARSRRVPPAIPSPASLRPRIRRPQRPSGGNLTGERPRIAYGKPRRPPRRPPGLARPRKPLGRRPPGPARPGKPLGRKSDFARTRRWRLPRQLATRPRARRLGPLPQATLRRQLPGQLAKRPRARRLGLLPRATLRTNRVRGTSPSLALPSAARAAWHPLQGGSSPRLLSPH
jgi:hypothetical protein